MNEYEIDTVLTIMADSEDAAMQFAREIFDANPVIAEYSFDRR